MTAANTSLVQQEETEIVNQAIVGDESGSQYLTFKLAGEEYGLNIVKVQEIKGWTPVTKVPNTPEYVCGVLNLRGTIVPIIDMRARFNLDQSEYTETTVIIVLSVESERGSRVVGIVVDAVSDVLNVNASDIKPTPDFGTTVDMEFISGLAAVGEQMVMLLEIDKMLSTDELKMLDGVNSSQAEQ